MYLEHKEAGYQAVLGADSVHSYRSLLIEVWSQLQQPGRLDSSHVSHVILGGLYDFIVDNPATRRRHGLISIPCAERQESGQSEMMRFFPSPSTGIYSACQALR